MGTSGSGKKTLLWVLGGSLAVGLILAVAGAVFLPILVVKWLGGDDFRRLASQQISSLLQTDGELQPLEWSSFSVYSAGFNSRPSAGGPWIWKIEELRTEVSPRLLLDRILRFPQITMAKLTLTPGTRPDIAPPEAAAAAPTGKSSPEIFRDVQVGTIEIDSLQLQASPATVGWGARQIRFSIQPNKQRTDFTLRGGEIVVPYPWIGDVRLDSAKGRYSPSTVFLTSLEATSPQGGTIRMSGEYTVGPETRAQGKLNWDRWSIPGGKIGVGLFEIPARMTGEFTLQELRSGSPVGQGQVRLVDARLQPGAAGKSILALLGLLTGDARLQQGGPLTTAQAHWSMRPGLYDVTQILAESPGLLRAIGQARVNGNDLSGRIELGLEQSLGSKVNSLTGGECFRRAEAGYLYETIHLSGTLEQPQNDLQAKLTSAITRTAIRTTVDILQKATGNTDPNTPAGAAGQILKSIFGPPPGR
jgi:hypothetical protein